MQEVAAVAAGVVAAGVEGVVVVANHRPVSVIHCMLTYFLFFSTRVLNEWSVLGC